MTTSYTLNNWDGGASVSNSNQDGSGSTSRESATTIDGRNLKWNDIGKSGETLDVKEMDLADPGRSDTCPNFGPLNSTRSQSKEPTAPSFIVNDVPAATSTETNDSTVTRQIFASDAPEASQGGADLLTFIPIASSALHSPGARKDASMTTPGPLLTKLLHNADASPGSPTPAPARQALSRPGLQSVSEREKELDSLSLHTIDAAGEDDDDDDVDVVEGLLQTFSPSKTDSHANNTPSQSIHSQAAHSSNSSTQSLQSHSHISLFTPPPSDEPASARMSPCPPADRLFTPEPSPSPSNRRRARSPDDVVIVTPRPRPLATSATNAGRNASITATSSKEKGKGKEKAKGQVVSKTKKKQVMAYVQVPPLKRPRSSYVKYGISGSAFASAMNIVGVSKPRPILGPPPSAAGPSSVRLPSPSTSSNKIPKKSVGTTKKPRLPTSSRASGANRNVGLSLGDALQASFNHNERLGTLDPGQLGRGGKKDKGKGKEKARYTDEDENDDDDYPSHARKKSSTKTTSTAPARIRPTGGIGYGYGPEHGGTRPPPSATSTASATTTSGSVAIVAYQRTPTTSKKRPRRELEDVIDVDGPDVDRRNSRGQGKKGSTVDIDLTMATSEEDLRGNVAVKSKRPRREEEDKDEEVQIVGVMRASTSAAQPRPKARPRPPLLSASTRPPTSSALMRPPAGPPRPSSPSKGKGQAISKPKPRDKLPVSSKSQVKETGKTYSSPLSISGSSSKTAPQKAIQKNKENVDTNPASKLKPKERVLYSYDAPNDVVRLVLGDLDPVPSGVLGCNLGKLLMELEQIRHVPIPAEDVQIEKRGGKFLDRMSAPWACRPRHPSTSSPGASPEEDEISLGYHTGLAASLQLQEGGPTKNKDARISKKGKKPVESLFSEPEEGVDEDGELQVESELEYETESDDVPLLRGARVVQRVHPASSASSVGYSLKPPVRSSGKQSASVPGPAGSMTAEPHRQLPLVPQQPQAPLKKIDLAAEYRKLREKGMARAADVQAGGVISASSSTRSNAAGKAAVGSSPSAARDESRAQPSSQTDQFYSYFNHSAPGIAASSLSISTPYTSINQSAPAAPSAKALGKRKAIDPNLPFAQGQFGPSTSASPPPPPYTPRILQHAFSALSNTTTGGVGAGASINVNLNATINHVHHNHLHPSPHRPQTPQNHLRDPNANLDVFLVSPTQSSVNEVGIEGASAGGGLYSAGYGQTLDLRDAAILLGASQSDFAHLYSPPGVPALGTSQEKADDGKFPSESMLDGYDLSQQAEDPWATFTDADGRYTYSTVDPSLIGGDEVFSENALFSEPEGDEAVRASEPLAFGENANTAFDNELGLPEASHASSPSSISLMSRSLSASATRPRPLSEEAPLLKSHPSVEDDTEEDDYLPPDAEMKSVPKKRKRKPGTLSGAPSQADVSPTIGDVSSAQSVGTGRSATTPGSDFSNVPLADSSRPRRKHIPRRMDDMVPSSEVAFRRKARKSDSEYAPSSASVRSIGGAETVEMSESDSEDRVIVVKRRRLDSDLPNPETTPSSLPRPKAIVKDGQWPMTNTETFCHQCRRKSKRLKMPCTCGRLFCVRCYAFRYPNEEFNAALKHFACPACLNYCNCTACCKKRGVKYVSSFRFPPGKRFAHGDKTSLRSIPVAISPPPIPVLTGPIPETATYWGSIYSLTTGEKLTSTFVTPDMDVDVASGAPTVVFAPVAAPLPPQPKKSKVIKKSRVFVGAVQKSWGLGRRPKIRVIEPYKSSVSTPGAKRFYIGNPEFLKCRLPEPEDPDADLLEGLSPLTSLDSSDEEADRAVDDDAGMT